MDIMRYEIEIVAEVGGTVYTERYTCDRVSANIRTQRSEAASVIIFTNGKDEIGRQIDYVIYERVFKLAKRKIEVNK